MVTGQTRSLFWHSYHPNTADTATKTLFLGQSQSVLGVVFQWHATNHFPASGHGLQPQGMVCQPQGMVSSLRARSPASGHGLPASGHDLQPQGMISNLRA